MYSDAISLCPDNASYYGNRAACQMMLADYKAALADARQALQIDSTFSKGYIRVAKCCMILGGKLKFLISWYFQNAKREIRRKYISLLKQ